MAKYGAMALLQIFRTRKNRQFNYTPRFYNKQKEELQARIRQIENEVHGTGEGNYSGSSIKGSFRQVHQKRTRQSRNSLLRILIILIILLLIVYFLYTL